VSDDKGGASRIASHGTGTMAKSSWVGNSTSLREGTEENSQTASTRLQFDSRQIIGSRGKATAAAAPSRERPLPIALMTIFSSGCRVSMTMACGRNSAPRTTSRRIRFEVNGLYLRRWRKIVESGRIVPLLDGRSGAFPCSLRF
jgi:hypothetical protein